MNEYNRFPLSKLHVVKLNAVGDLHFLNCWQCICCLSDSRRVPCQQPSKRAYHHRELLELPQYHRTSPMFGPFRSTNLFRPFLEGTGALQDQFAVLDQFSQAFAENYKLTPGYFGKERVIYLLQAREK